MSLSYSRPINLRVNTLVAALTLSRYTKQNRPTWWLTLAYYTGGMKYSLLRAGGRGHCRPPAPGVSDGRGTISCVVPQRDTSTPAQIHK
jgi:hypothetical protein